MKYGPMNDVRRFDRPAAIIATILSKAFGGKVKMKDLMPYGQEPERQATFAELVKELGGNIAKPR